MALPPGFTAIKDAASIRADSTVSLLGVIVHFEAPCPTRGTDWKLEFTIQDASSQVKCRLFLPSLDSFPKITGEGDVAMLRDFRLEQWIGTFTCISVKSRSSILVFCKDKIPVPELSSSYQVNSLHLPYTPLAYSKPPTSEEQMAIIHLKHAYKSFAQVQPQEHSLTSTFTAPTASMKRDRVALIKDLDFNRYYDLNVEVVNIYWNNLGNVELKVTDYTENKNLFLYADPDDPDQWYQNKTWTGPYGQYTLSLVLYGNNSSWARDNLNQGDFVRLKNVHTKLSPANILEGVLHEDRIRTQQVDIWKLTNQNAIDEIKRRQTEYEQNQLKKTAFEEMQNVPKKPSAKASARRKAERKAKQKLQREQDQKELAEQAEVWEAERSGINLNVRAAFPEIQPSTISEIIYNPALNGTTPERYNAYKLPFVNCKYRSRVRVIDFFPPELELFAHSMVDQAWNPISKAPDTENVHENNRWEWGFVLLVEDAYMPPNTVSEKLRLLVSNEAAQHLLDMDAQDLNKNEKALGQLKEKLFILWGNLLELKTELRDRGADLPLPPGDNRLNNKPFDCCIEEYGHKIPPTEKDPLGYQRMHKLAATKIQTTAL